MADVLWGLWMRLRVATAKFQRYLFTVGKWAALAFILIYVLGIMAGATLSGLGYPELGGPILEFIGTVNEFAKGFIGSS